MSDYAELVTLVRRKVGFPPPETGGDDKLSDAVVIEYLNNAFDQMCDAIFGFDRYVEFTITAAGVITVTDPTTAAEQPTVAATADPVLGSYPVYTISDARSYEKVENKTVPIVAGAAREMVDRPINSRSLQGTYNSTVTYYVYYSIQGTRGFTMLPLTITQTNTIGITYRRKFTRYAVTDPDFTGTGEDDMTVTLAAILTGNDGMTTEYVVEIDGGDPADPNTFRWSNDGGATWEASAVAITGAAQTLENGFTVTFGATTGHVTGDSWAWTATAPLLTVMEEEEQRGFPVLRAAAECGRDVDESRYWYWLLEAQGRDYPKEIGGLLLAFREKRLTEDLTFRESLADPYESAARWY